MSRAKILALGGVLAAFNLLLLYFSSVLPTSRLFILSICSFVVSVVVIETTLKNAVIFYLATSVLGFFLVPGKAMVILYICFFGIYGIVKAVIENLKTRPLQYALKFLSFNGSLFIIYHAVKIVSGAAFAIENLPFPAWALLIVLQIAFILYDYVFTVFVTYYYNHIKGRIG
jgi:hypothetical protein